MNRNVYHSIASLILALVTSFSSFVPVFAASPSNDSFTGATLISFPLPVSSTVDITEATLETGEPNSSCAWYGSLWKTIWYVYTPSVNGVISANAFSSSFAPVTTVYTGSSFDTLAELKCQVFNGNQLTFPVEAGNTYYFQIGKLTSWDPDGGVEFHVVPSFIANEGELITLDAGHLYPSNGETLNYDWDIDNDGQYDDASGTTTQVTFVDDGEYLIGLSVSDAFGFRGTVSATVFVQNVVVTIGAINVAINPIPVNTVVSTSVNFTDPGVLDTHTATWYWIRRRSPTIGIVDESNGTGTVTGSFSYSTPGVYAIIVKIQDNSGAEEESSYEYIVVYDPNGGYATGNGWIISPPGAYVADPTLTGKANFGFVSKYEKRTSVPKGNTEFQFNIANLYFKSTSFDWMVVTGSKVQFKGTGVINDKDNYGFMLTAIDDSPDKFRIKIWDKATDIVIYDNMLDHADSAEPVTALGGGEIVIHRSK